jgi:hypothetical protein
MSAALQIFAQAADALAVVHDDPLVLQPGAIAVSGYAQELETDPVERGGSRKRPLQLHTAEDLVSHVVHVRRTVMIKAGAYTLQTLQGINLITRPDSTKRYRVRHFTDDPDRAEVQFHCTLA